MRWMTRRGWLLLAGAGAMACRRPTPPDISALLAPEVAGWRRASLQPIGANPVPGARRALEAQYRTSAPGSLVVDAYEMTSSATALDAVQRFRATGDRVAFYRDNIYFVVRLGGADRKAAHDFIRALEAPPPARK